MESKRIWNNWDSFLTRFLSLVPLGTDGLLIDLKNVEKKL